MGEEKHRALVFRRQSRRYSLLTCPPNIDTEESQEGQTVITKAVIPGLEEER